MSMGNHSPSALWRQFEERYTEARTAKLITWSTIHVGPDGFEADTPYIVAIVEFTDSTRACVQLTDIDESRLDHGMELRPVFRRIRTPNASDVITYGTKYTV